MSDRLDDQPARADPNTVAPARVVGQPVAAPRAETVRLYAADWLDFVGWCRANGRHALHAGAETLATYLLAVAPGLSRGALGRRRAAIGSMHRQQGLFVSRLDAPARAALRQTARHKEKSSGAAPRDASALTRAALRCARDLAGLRDRALLLLVAATAAPEERGRRHRQTATAVTRQALLALIREQIRFVDAGIALQLCDEGVVGAPGAPVIVARATAAASCPVRAMEDWLRASDTRFGPVFRKIDRWGNIEHAGLGPDGLRRIIARRSDPLRRRRACPVKHP